MPSFFTRALSPRGDSFFPLRRTFKKVKTPQPPQKPQSDILMADIPLSPSPPASSHGGTHDNLLSPVNTNHSLRTAPVVDGLVTPTKNVAFSRLPGHVGIYHHNEPAEGPSSSSRATGNHARELDSEAEAIFFSGPPPPIVRSIYMTSPSASPSSSPTREGRTSAGNLAASLASLGSVFFDTGRTRKQPARYQRSPDSMWRRMQRHEKALSEELQSILDMQASAIAQGFTGGSRTASPSSSFSAAGSSPGEASPGVTFYSAATSKSKMNKSLYQTNSHSRDGTMLPVHQPKTPKKLGLRAARRALSRSLAELSDLKHHEHRHIKAEIKTRNRALSRAERLAARQLQISTELKALETDDDEELARELRDLTKEQDDVAKEIAELESRLIVLRNKQRSLNDKVTHVASKREAGLSGYRGALKEVDAEIASLVCAPPVEPLQTEAYADLADEVVDDDGTAITTPGGPEFLAMLPERRTLDMAKQWWEAEIKLLEAKSDRVKKDRVALEEGGQVWAATTKLVGEYESTLSRQMKALAENGSANLPVASAIDVEDAKQVAETRAADETINKLMEQMDSVIEVLRHNLSVATNKKWNLLICAIGAELAAFEEAESMLRFGMPAPTETRAASRAAAEDLLMQSLESHIASGSGNTTPKRRGSYRRPNDDNADDNEEATERKFKANRVIGLGSPVPKTFVQSSESLPSPAFKPYRPGGDEEGYSDNEVPDDLLLGEV